MTVTVPTSLWAKVLKRAAETDQRWPWIRQVQFYETAAITIADDLTTIDLERAEQAQPTKH